MLRNMSKKMGSALRMLAMLRLIPRRGKIDTATLRTRLAGLGWNVSRRTIQRDLRQLQSVFPDLLCDENRDIPGWFWRADAAVIDIPAIDPALALTLVMARAFLAPVMPPWVLSQMNPYFQAAERLADRHRTGAWSERIAVIPRTLPLLPAEIKEAVYDAVSQALTEDKALQARYRSRHGSACEYQLHPLGLVFRHEVTYLVATAWHYDDPRHFALHRFESCQVLDIPARRPQGFDFQTYLRQGAFQYPKPEDALIELVLRVHRNTAVHLGETPLSEDQRLDPLEGDWMRLRATVLDSEQLHWWILAMGENVVVEAPAALRRAIRHRLGRAAAGYRKETDG